MPIMSRLMLKPAHLVSKPGQFGAVVGDKFVLLPVNVARSFAAVGARDVVAALSYLESFPSALAEELHWKLPDVMHAADELRGQLRGHVADGLLDPIEPAEPRVYGAIKP